MKKTINLLLIILILLPINLLQSNFLTNATVINNENGEIVEKNIQFGEIDENNFDYDHESIEMINTYSLFEVNEEFSNSFSPSKQNVGMQTIVVRENNEKVNYQDDTIKIVDGKIISAYDAAVYTIGGYQNIINIYETLEDLLNDINPLPLGGVGYDGEFIETIEMNDEKYVKFLYDGNEYYTNFNNVEIIPNSEVKAKTHYQKEGNNWYLYEAVDIINSNKYTKYLIDDAPDWANEQEIYYKNISDTYTTDLKVYDNTKSSFNYFKYLPSRSTSDYTAQDYQRFLQAYGKTNSQYYHVTQAFIDAQNYKGINSLVLFAMANHESAYGTSYYAKTCNNFYGRGAYDSNPDMACSVAHFSTPYDGVGAQAFFLSNDFLDNVDWRYFGSHVGDGLSGMNVKYASDKRWGEKISGLMKEIDDFLGQKEYNKYSIGLVDHGPYAYKDSNLTQIQQIVKETGTNDEIKNYRVQGIGGQSIPIIISKQEGNSYQFSLDTGRNTGSDGHYYATIASYGSFPIYEGPSSYGGYIPNGVSSFAINYGEFINQQAYVAIQYVRIQNHTNFTMPGKPYDPLYNQKLECNNVASDLVYNAHFAYEGWLDPVKNGEQTAKIENKRSLEAFGIDLKTPNPNSIEYRAFVQNKGWMDKKSEKETAGTIGEGLRLEAFQINLTNEMYKNHDIYYRCYVENYGWLGWAKNGDIAGSIDFGLGIFGIEIKLLSKNEVFNEEVGNSYLSRTNYLNFQTHFANQGWSVAYNNNTQLDNTNQQLEAIKISIPYNVEGNIVYQAHVQNKGWMDPVKNGEIAGTLDEGLRLEALKIDLEGNLKNNYNIWYRCYVENYGWLGWASNNEIIGSINRGLKITGLHVILLPKDEKPLEEIGNSSINDIKKYRSYVETKGWTNYQGDGEIIGSMGLALKQEAIQIEAPLNLNGTLSYQTHIQNRGWIPAVLSGEVSGEVESGLQIEAITIGLDENLSKNYDIYYRGHVQDHGWLDWTKNGDIVGSLGKGLRLEGLEIKILPKNEKIECGDKPVIM